MYKYILATALVSFCTTFSAIAAEPGRTIEDRFVSMALQGDLRPAKDLFRYAHNETDASNASDLARRFDSRFIVQSENLSVHTGDSLVDAIVLAYRYYWVRTLTGTESFGGGTTALEQALYQLLGQNGIDTSDTPLDIFALTGSVLHDRGFYYLDTPAPPLRDLFLWKRERHGKYTLRLTDRSQRVNVTFMDEFFSLGWKHFATLGLISTTGWVEGDRLYCVESAYDPVSENFRVSYLKHEGRHLADYQRYPGLPSESLEYRAKLTELAFADMTLWKLLDDFTIQSSPDTASPHAHANFQVTRDLYRELYGQPFPQAGNPWRDLDKSAITQAARLLLQRDTERLDAVAQQD